jgi:hypothetical protein
LKEVKTSPVHGEIREGGRVLAKTSEIGGTITVQPVGVNRKERRRNAAKVLRREARKATR